MNNKTLIVTGLVIFLIIVLFPFWYMRGEAAPMPEPISTAVCPGKAPQLVWPRPNRMPGQTLTPIPP